MLLLMSCVSATIVVKTSCVVIDPPTEIVVNVLATIRDLESRQWVVQLSKLYNVWDNKLICDTIKHIGSIR